MPERRLVRNGIRCNTCKDTIYSTHRHDFRSCKCGAVFVDGGLDYQRVGWNPGHTFTDVAEYEDVPEPL